MKINGKELTVPQMFGIAGAIFTIVGALTTGGFFVHGYFAKSAELVTMQTELTSYKKEQESTVLQLKQNAQIEIWTTEQTFIVIRKDTILDRLSTESKKESPDSFQVNRWEDQLDTLNTRQAEIKTSNEALRLRMQLGN